MHTIVPWVRRHGARLCAAGLLAMMPMSSCIAGTLVGVVTDYGPRDLNTGPPLVTMQRGNDVLPVKDQAPVYDDDQFVFTKQSGKQSGQTPFVTVQIGATEEVTLHETNPEIPKGAGLALRQFETRLIAVYKWINPPGSDKQVPAEAQSRGEQTLAVLPALTGNGRTKLVVSDDGSKPLWIGWTGGKPPFDVLAKIAGKTIAERKVCSEGETPSCLREAMIEGLTNDAEPLSLSIVAVDGSTWSQSLARKPIIPVGNVASVANLGKLGVFIEATELLDRGHGEYVLESARMLASIAKDYHPARELLDHIRDGPVP